MSNDWEKLAGEKGERVQTSRFKRALTLGSMGARVTASTLAGKLGSMVMPASRDKRDEYLQRAYEKNAHRVVEALGRLKGASMKIGQLLSADPELLPGEFSDMLSSLQRDAPPMTWQTVQSQIEAAFDQPIETIFRYFDPDPIGAASIGQVHRATLMSGEEVAVKVQYPGVVESLESDLKSLGAMLVYGRAMIDKPRLDAYLNEIREVILQEADYEAEARNLARFHAIFEEREGLACPRPFEQWTRKSVLVMEFMEGRKLDEALAEMEDGPRRQAVLMRWVETYSWMFHELHELHADPHPGNFLLADDDTLVLLDFGCVKSFEPEFTDSFLDILDACWQDDPERALELYVKMGFGTRQLGELRIEPEVLREFHEALLGPFLRDAPFRYADWAPARDSKRFMLRNPGMLALVPPPEALPYFRVLSGIKGLLAKLDAEINVCRMAVETARRRGRLTAEPVIF